jgi:hypothetical protein
MLSPLLAVVMAFAATVAGAEEVVDLGGFLGSGKALLNKPAGKASAGLVLLTGGDGYIGISGNGDITSQGNWIVRTRGAYARSGIASILLDGGADPAKAVELMRTIAPRVVVVAMSRGSLKVPALLGTRPDGIVLASSFLDDVQSEIGSASRLPPTLVIHHRQDGCSETLPDLVEPFQAWAGSRARTIWIEGGSSTGNPCRAQAYHGFIGRENAVVSSIVGFTRSLR